MDRAAQSTGGSSCASTKTSRSTRGPRVALACKRCKRRKQRCEAGHPTCRSCERVGVPCIYEKTVRPQYPGGKVSYINTLEERIAFLESRLPAYAEDHFVSAPESTDAAGIRSGEAIPGPSHLDSSSSHHGSISDDLEVEESNSLVDGVAYLSLRASGATDTAPEPFYLGSSSGATIARMIQTSIFRSSSGGRAIPRNPVAGHPSPSHLGVHFPGLSPETAQTYASDPSLDFLTSDQAQLLFDTFFDRLHTRWPLLDRKTYADLFDRRHTPGALSTMERSIMHLIYAIAARFLQLTRDPCGVDPERHLMAAIYPMDYILEHHSLGTVQFLLLLALHGQRSPYGAGAWSQVRYAVALCIELGLHRERRGASAPRDSRDLEVRRRAFWSCYCLERGTSVILGRAFAIADRDINVELPSASLEFWDLTHKEPPEASQDRPWSNIEPFIHIIKLERIQSRIHRTAFRVDKDVLSGPPSEREKLDRKMACIRGDLDNWLETTPHPPKNAKKITWMYDPESANHDSQDFFSLQYHKVVLSLFAVLLPTLTPSDHRFVTTARASARVCVAYKRLNQQKTLSYTMISLHSCFVAGLTLVYCLWRDKTLFGYDVFEATQACSQSLTIFGEKWAGAVKYRDIFDALSGSLFKKIVSPEAAAAGGGVGARVGSTARARPGRDERESGSPPGTQQSPGGGREANLRAREPEMSDLVSDAVKDAFMEVDEEAPRGWQGWRMWNEMLGDGWSASSPPGQGRGWGGCELDADPLQNTALAEHHDPMESDEWGFGGIEGFE